MIARPIRRDASAASVSLNDKAQPPAGALAEAGRLQRVLGGFSVLWFPVISSNIAVLIQFFNVNR